MTIGIWGDSIIYGEGDSEALGWVGRLRKSQLKNDSSLYNFGICGDTSAGLLKRFKIEAEATNPDIIIFAVGINDSKYPNDSNESLVPPKEYLTNLEELISQARKFTNNIFIVSATKVDNEWESVRGSRFMNEVIESYNELMRGTAEKHSIEFVDMFEVLDPASDLSDGLHPNRKGYQKMFEVIKSRIEL